MALWHCCTITFQLRTWKIAASMPSQQIFRNSCVCASNIFPSYSRPVNPCGCESSQWKNDPDRATILRPSLPVGSQETHRFVRPIGRYPAGSSDFPGSICPSLVVAVSYNPISGMTYMSSCPLMLRKARNCMFVNLSMFFLVIYI